MGCCSPGGARLRAHVPPDSRLASRTERPPRQPSHGRYEAGVSAAQAAEGAPHLSRRGQQASRRGARQQPTVCPRRKAASRGREGQGADTTGAESAWFTGVTRERKRTLSPGATPGGNRAPSPDLPWGFAPSPRGPHERREGAVSGRERPREATSRWAGAARGAEDRGRGTATHGTHGRAAPLGITRVGSDLVPPSPGHPEQGAAGTALASEDVPHRNPSAGHAMPPRPTFGATRQGDGVIKRKTVGQRLRRGRQERGTGGRTNRPFTSPSAVST
jgi:hypothetical protein